MTASRRWDYALRGAIAACSIAVLFLPFSEVSLGSPSSLAILSGWLVLIYLPLPVCAILALASPLVPGLARHGPLLDSLVALLAFGFVVAVALYLLLAGLGVVALFFLLMAFFIPFFWDMGLLVQAGSYLLMTAFVLALVQMARSNGARRENADAPS